jgi:hypothetical protein
MSNKITTLKTMFSQVRRQRIHDGGRGDIDPTNYAGRNATTYLYTFSSNTNEFGKQEININRSCRRTEMHDIISEKEENIEIMHAEEQIYDLSQKRIDILSKRIQKSRYINSH